MIFLTVGTQLGFDRMVKTVDGWVKEAPEVKVFAQIGEATYQPQNMEFCAFLSASEYTKIFEQATVVVSHAGMGTILSCLTQSKPIIVMPRLEKLGEHRNDHQIATCKRFENISGCNVAYDEAELLKMLDGLASLDAGSLSPYASGSLISAIDEYIAS